MKKQPLLLIKSKIHSGTFQPVYYIRLHKGTYQNTNCISLVYICKYVFHWIDYCEVEQWYK